MNIRKILKEEITNSIVDKVLMYVDKFDTPHLTIYDYSGSLVNFNFFLPVGDSIKISGYDEDDNIKFPSNVLNIFNTMKTDENVLIVKEYTTRAVFKGKAFNDLNELKNYAEINKLENVFIVKDNKKNAVSIETIIPNYSINKSKNDVVYPQDLLSRLTLDGPLVTLFHYGNSELENGMLDPKYYKTNNYTTDTGGIDRIFFYIDKKDKERIVGGKEYIVKVPLTDFYPFNSDPLNFYNDAVKAYGSENVPIARQMGYITSQALKYGFKGMFFKWEGTYRADYFFPIKPLNS